jgi:hypothetical protein
VHHHWCRTLSQVPDLVRPFFVPEVVAKLPGQFNDQGAKRALFSIEKDQQREVPRGVFEHVGVVSRDFHVGKKMVRTFFVPEVVCFSLVGYIFLKVGGVFSLYSDLRNMRRYSIR